MGRIPVSGDKQDQVLLSSRRRCCICSGLRGDFDEKQGQIAHLDHDSNNDDVDNLAFLCLLHHDQYDSKTSQSKGLRESEVRYFRGELYGAISGRLTVGQGTPVQTTDSNLQADFDSGPLGAIYLTPEGVWSTPYSGSAAEWIGLRMKVSNVVLEGKKIGPAKSISVRIKFEHDTGLDAACAAPTAWLHEKHGYVDIKPGEEKEAIIAVRSKTEWYTVTNVRDASGYPSDASAMKFHSAPWFSGKLHIGLILDGEVIERHYTWEVPTTQENGLLKSGFPRIRRLN